MTDAPTEPMTELALFELLSLECRVAADGAIRYYNAQGQLHRLYGPAVEWADGTRSWFSNGKRHRLDGPAIVYGDGSRAWFRNGLRHREDGPAVEYPDGYSAWFINGEELTKAEWRRAVAGMEIL